MSARLGLPGLRTAHPVGATLPGLYEDDALAGVLTGAFDGMLAPVHTTLDCLTSYVDAGQAPDDFVDWLGAWLAAPLDRWMPLERRRRVVAATAELQRARGTRRGVVRLLELTLEARDVEVDGGGGTWWSPDPGAVVPEGIDPVVVRLTLPAAEPADGDRIERLLASALPAHVPFRVEVTVDAAVPELRQGQRA